MNLLPFVIVFLSSALILKTSNLTEKILKNPGFTLTKVSEEKVLEPGKKTEESAKPEDKKKSEEIYPDEASVKECLSYKAKYTENELEILEKLKNKKEELDKREQNIDEKEKLIDVATGQLEKKIEVLKSKEESIKSLLAEYSNKEDAKIDHLVRIYQSMKPDKAAKLFDNMSMDILIKVVDKMKEANSGSIISLMDPARATELTSRLAEQKELKQDFQAK